MRLVVILSPTNKRGTKMPYTTMRKFLVSDGYECVAPEVFIRVVTGRKGAEKHIRRLEEHDPGTGTIRVFRLTEKQYAGMQYLTGGPSAQEQIVGKNNHIAL